MQPSGIGFVAPLAACMGLFVFACGGETESGQAAWGAPPSAADEQTERARSDDAAAPDVLHELTVRHARALAPAARAESARLRFEQELARWVVPSGAGTSAWSAAFPQLADEPLELQDETSGLRVEVRARGAAPVPGGQAGEFLVYPNAHGPGTTLLYRAFEHGFEDYVAFDEPPPEAALSYDLALSDDVFGLRLVSHTLELLDEGGAPRLRVSPPYLVDRDGRRVPAELTVKDCAFDSDPAPPWHRPPVAPGAQECRIEITWDDAALRYPVLLDPVWSSAGNMAVGRQRFAALLLPSGRVLAAGGLSGSPPIAASAAELYDPITRTWAVTGALALPRSEHALTLRPDGAVLVTGGRSGEGELTASVESYEESLGVFLEAEPLPEPRAGHRAVLLSNGDVLVAGGVGSSAAARRRRAGSTWEVSGSYGSEQPGASLTALSGGRAMLLGPNPPNAQLFDALTGSWQPTGAPALGRSRHTATRLANGHVLIAGGTGEHGAELYEPQSGSFRSVGATDDSHASHSATLLPNGYVALVGGAATTGTELFNPVWGTWSPGPAPYEARARHEAVLLPNGRLLIAGGVPASSEVSGPDPEAEPAAALASAEELDVRLASAKLSEYKLPAALDTDVSSVVTELWAAVARPSVLEPGRRYPLILFLHGNHATCGSGSNPRQDIDCTYTEEGVCPAGLVVVPSHRGYDYIISELAARGYVVVSVNANRGINCGGNDPEDSSMNLARGRLLLKHLQQLSEWHRGVTPTPPSVGVSLLGKLDFSQVGIMGHSRGGEGARAAHQQFRDPGSPWPARVVEPLAIRAIFEIAPVDGQTPRTFNADGMAWSVLLPMCDGDVSDLQGVKPFDRMLGLSSEAPDAFKATYTAWGTNHNYFNTEWQESDSQGCINHAALFASGPGITGSAEQRQIALRSVLAFFLGSVGHQADPALTELFDPLVPIDFRTRIDRGYTSGLGRARARELENFSAPSGQGMLRIPTVASGVSVGHGPLPDHDPGLRGATIAWSAPNAERFFELRFTSDEAGLDLTAYDLLEFRIDRAVGLPNPAEASNVLVQLVSPDGALSGVVDLAERGIVLDGPVGGPFELHSMLQSVRIPFADFTDASAAAVAGVRFSFVDPVGALYLANVRASTAEVSKAAVSSLEAPAPPPPRGPSVSRASPARALDASGNRFVSLRLAQDQAAGASVELELQTARAFRVRDEQLVLDLGGKAKTARSYHPGGDLRRVIFSIDPATYAAASDGDALTVQYGATSPEKAAEKWEFGPLDKSKLTP